MMGGEIRGLMMGRRDTRPHDGEERYEASSWEGEIRGLMMGRRDAK